MTKIKWETQRTETVGDIQGNITGGASKEFTGCTEIKE